MYLPIELNSPILLGAIGHPDVAPGILALLGSMTRPLKRPVT
jgi:hypothetical protein